MGRRVKKIKIVNINSGRLRDLKRQGNRGWWQGLDFAKASILNLQLK